MRLQALDLRLQKLGRHCQLADLGLQPSDLGIPRIIRKSKPTVVTRADGGTAVAGPDAGMAAAARDAALASIDAAAPSLSRT